MAQNKYHIGDRIKFLNEFGKEHTGTIYEIKALTKRHNASTFKEGYSEIVKDAALGYKCLGFNNRVRGVDILELISSDQYL